MKEWMRQRAWDIGRRHLVTLVTCGLLMGIFPLEAAPIPPPEAGNTNLVLEIRQVFSFMAGSDDPGPTVKLYADGTAEAHFPVYMPDAGDYQVRLNTGRWQALWRQLDQHGPGSFDADAAKQAKQADREQRRQQEVSRGQAVTVRHASDPETIVMVQHRLPGAADKLPEPRVIRWQGLVADTRLHPGIGALRGLRNSVDALLDLGRHPDRIPRRTAPKGATP